MTELLVAVTLDCEPPNIEALPGVTGPASWDQSAAFIRSYCEIAAGAGFPATLFLHPEVAVHQHVVLHELEKTGVSISGLHLHPWKYDPVDSLTHLGLMAEGPQRDILTRASEEWAQGIGRRPTYFRPGTFSANDATAGIAADLGFLGVSMSVPGRHFPELGAIWAGCPADPHRMHPAMRLLDGDMALPNMPLTVDFSQTRTRGNRSWHPDLRPDQKYDDLTGSVSRVVDQIIARAPAVPVFNIVTHNDNDYTDKDNWVRRNLEAILAALAQVAEARGISLRGATIEDVCASVSSLPPPDLDFVRV